ncbi:hypothetical protein PIB30_037767 [Stylosanthes scabra]|uniref:Uncharacterized protein n=1 Tax=Stylosanthes scabra TaxID=79078 RepID=A0ABU6VBR0_9FABA|nr:hypothetical protein [Stylosanthes scabra]
MLVVSSHAYYVSQVLDYLAHPFQQPLLGQYLQLLLLESYQKSDDKSIAEPTITSLPLHLWLYYLENKLHGFPNQPPFFCTTEKAVSVEVLVAVVAKSITVIASLRPVVAAVEVNLKKGTGDSGKKKRSRSGGHTSVVVDQRCRLHSGGGGGSEMAVMDLR